MAQCALLVLLLVVVIGTEGQKEPTMDGEVNVNIKIKPK
jgi:hypothetical protein